MKNAIAAEVTKAVPPATITLASTVGGIALNEWVAIVTIVYVALQAGYLIYKWVREHRAGK